MSIWRFDYAPHAAFVAPAIPKGQLWRLLIGIVLIAAFFLALSQMLVNTVMSLAGGNGPSFADPEAPVGQSPGEVLLLLAQLGLLGVSAGLVCIVAHNRAPTTLVGPRTKAIGQFTAVLFVLVLIVLALLLLPPYGFDEPMQRNMGLATWLLLLPVGLIAVLIQVSAEELLFRGYLQQQLAALSTSPFVWMILPSAIFGALHYTPSSAGSNAMTIAVLAGVFGLITADLTGRSGTLGPAIALHFINNVQAILITSPPDEMSGLALYVLPFGLGDEAKMAQWLPVDLGWMLVAWLGARLAIRA
mgnify:CR=1 FL=1